MSLLFVRWAILIGIGCYCVLKLNIPLSHVVLPIVAIMILDWYSQEQQQQSPPATVQDEKDVTTTTAAASDEHIDENSQLSLTTDTTTNIIDTQTTTNTEPAATTTATTTTTTATTISGAVVEQQKTTVTVNNEVDAATVASSSTTSQQPTTITNSSDIQKEQQSEEQPPATVEDDEQKDVTTRTTANDNEYMDSHSNTTTNTTNIQAIEPVAEQKVTYDAVDTLDTSTTPETVEQSVKPCDDVLILSELNDKLIGKDFQTKKKIAIEEIECNPLVYYLLEENLRKDEEVANLAVEKNYENLLFCPKGITTSWKIFQIVFQDIKNDHKKFSLLERFNVNSFSNNIVENNEIIPFIMSFWNSKMEIVKSLKIYSIKEFVLEIVKRDGLALQFASELLKRDREVVLLAVKQNGRALQFASQWLYNTTLVLEAIEQNPSAIELVLEGVEHNNWRDDKDVMLEVVKNNGLFLKHASDRLKDDAQLVRIAVEKNGLALQFASYRLKNDEDLVLIAVKKNGFALEFANERLKNQTFIVSAALSSVEENDKIKIEKLAGYGYKNTWGGYKIYGATSKEYYNNKR